MLRQLLTYLFGHSAAMPAAARALEGLCEL